jgi:hypothetical protein
VIIMQHTRSLRRLSQALCLAPLTLAIATPVAFAVSDQVRQLCREDYFTHCPNHAVGSANLRRCMKTAGPKLSSGCVRALVASGEISQAEVRGIARRLKASP